MANAFTSATITNIAGVNNWVDGIEATTTFDVSGVASFSPSATINAGDTFSVILGFGGGKKMTVTGTVATVDNVNHTITWTAPCSNLASLLSDAEGTKRMTASISTDPGPLNNQYVTSAQQTFAYLSCFVRGTLLSTPDGERAVETLQAGDMVLTASGAARPVKWLGRRVVKASRHVFAGRIAPVRVCRAAFADGVPARDVLLSPDHAVLVDGKLIPVRQLVNGASVLLEPHQPEVEYFHVELDTHDVLLASGLPVESYLDAGDRGFFANGGVQVELHPTLDEQSGYRARENASCMPFVTDEQSVQPVWQRLVERAQTKGQQVPSQPVVADPDLHLTIDGARVDAVSRTGSRYVFPLPDGSAVVRVMSRNALPIDSRPWMEDTRQLGVRIARLRLRQGSSVEDISLDGPALHDGWWSIERDGPDLRRWTDGDAMLTLPRPARMAMLEVELSDVLAYPDRKAA
ncbi:MAG: Hint domain-containing protein [Proteobacteria bacterium]|nr:Hint domain-containing protein [Pseudomonadota bacterium]